MGSCNLYVGVAGQSTFYWWCTMVVHHVHSMTRVCSGLKWCMARYLDCEPKAYVV